MLSTWVKWVIGISAFILAVVIIGAFVWWGLKIRSSGKAQKIQGSLQQLQSESGESKNGRNYVRSAYFNSGRFRDALEDNPADQTQVVLNEANKAAFDVIQKQKFQGPSRKSAFDAINGFITSFAGRDKIRWNNQKQEYEAI